MTRFFAWGELIFFPLSIITLIAMLISLGVRLAGVELPATWMRTVLPLLCSGAVGYLTNYIAVRMLFEPYHRRGFHWLKALTLGLWQEGLVPARRHLLGETMGREVADKLLTPEIITEELTRLANSTFDDADFRAKLPGMLRPLVQRGLPQALESLAPQMTNLIQAGIADNLTSENIRDFIHRLVVPWMGSPSNRERLVDGVIQFLDQQSPKLVGFMRTTAESYGKRGPMQEMFLNMAQSSGALDWNIIGNILRDQLGSPQSRDDLASAVDQLIAKLQVNLELATEGDGLGKLREQASRFAAELVQGFITTKLPTVIEKFLDTPEFWAWVSSDGLDAVKPQLTQWLQEHGVELIGKRFDVAGRVQKAVDGMDIATVHAMVDNVATEQLGAIQVLGYVLGLIAGIPLVILLSQ